MNKLDLKISGAQLTEQLDESNDLKTTTHVFAKRDSLRSVTVMLKWIFLEMPENLQRSLSFVDRSKILRTLSELCVL